MCMSACDNNKNGAKSEQQLKHNSNKQLAHPLCCGIVCVEMNIKIESEKQLFIAWETASLFIIEENEIIVDSHYEKSWNLKKKMLQATRQTFWHYMRERERKSNDFICLS